MSLKYKYLAWTSVLLALVAVFGVATVVTLAQHWRAARATVWAYDAMDHADAAAEQVRWLREGLIGADAKLYRDERQFSAARTEIADAVRIFALTRQRSDDVAAASAVDLSRSAADHLDAAVRSATAVPAAAGASLAAAIELAKSREALLSAAHLVPSSVRQHVETSAGQLFRSLQYLCALLLVVLLLSATVHFKQFRLLVRPLVLLRDDMKRSAAREYREMVPARGDVEFRDVANYFNGLARDLAKLYDDLEQKVIARSRELVRSERLASVGFLAAGVAHEINNPLSIISGYAELATRSLTRLVAGGPGSSNGDGASVALGAGVEAEAEAEAEALAGAVEAQQIIRDEAFRCKEITSRLLSLARGGGDGRESLRLDDMARQVTVLTKGLKNYRDRLVVLDFDGEQSLEIVANPTEMKQVLLNLTVNALEATPPQRGEVRIGGRRRGEWVELSVQDNGKGMSAEMLQHVFEPFFTAKRGAGEPGTGLGLSITHAIVENHGGRIEAESNGPGRGSRFTLRLPAIGGDSNARSTATVAGRE